MDIMEIEAELIEAMNSFSLKPCEVPLWHVNEDLFPLGALKEVIDNFDKPEFDSLALKTRLEAIHASMEPESTFDEGIRQWNSGQEEPSSTCAVQACDNMIGDIGPFCWQHICLHSRCQDQWNDLDSRFCQKHYEKHYGNF